MKKLLALLLCICALTVPALAVDADSFWYQDGSGTWVYDRDAYNAAVAVEKCEAAGFNTAALVDPYWLTNEDGTAYFDNDAFEAAYAAAMEEKEAQEAAQAEAEAAATEEQAATEQPTESEVTNNETSSSMVAGTDDDTGYPVGSFIDEDGNVWSPDGELLSGEAVTADDTSAGDSSVTEPSVYVVNDLRGAATATSETYAASTYAIEWYNNQLYNGIDTDGSLYNGTGYLMGYILNGGSIASSATTTDKFVTGYIPLAELSSVIRLKDVGGFSKYLRISFFDETFSFIEGFTNPTDLFTADSSGILEYTYTGEAAYFRISGTFSENTVITVNEEITEHYGDQTPVLSALKAVVVSIFGEYTPVYSTGYVTETVGDTTTTTLYDVVADGAAGIDFEWCAGVFLFGILLYCLMRLFGGILK